MNWKPSTDSTPSSDISLPTTTIDSPLPSPLLYSTDCGELPLETRRVLVNLLLGPFIDGRKHHALWNTLLQDEETIRQRLSELFLDLILDRESQIAFTRLAETEDIDAPSLLRSVTLNFLDSVLLLQLRLFLTQADARGERAVISSEEIIESLSPYQNSDSTDSAGFIKKINASKEKMKRYKILLSIRGSEDRFEISPTLKILFSADEIQSLTQQYKNMKTVPSASEQEEDIE